MTNLPVTPSFRLNGKRALVTGGGRGIGAAAATALAQAGAHVDMVARTGSQVTAIAQALRDADHQAAGYSLDVLDTAATEAFIADNGPYQILVNNAGMNRPATLMDVSEQDYDAVTDLNVRATVFVSRAVVKGLLAKQLPGSIINVGSQMGHVGGPKRIVYCATKHAVEGVTKAMAWELGPNQIRVNTVCPTFIKTELTSAWMEDPDFMNFVQERIALGRLGKVEDLMGAFLFLASDASAMVTGTALMVDGGWTAA